MADSETSPLGSPLRLDPSGPEEATRTGGFNGGFNGDLTTTSLEIMVSKGNHPQIALIQISELL